MVIRWILYVYAIVYSTYAYLSHQTINFSLLVLCGVLYIASLLISRSKSYMPWTRLLLLSLFHWLCQLNIGLPLFLLTMYRDIYEDDRPTRSWSLVAAYTLCYILTTRYVSLSVVSHSLWLNPVMIALHFATIALLTRINRKTIKQTEKLRDEQACLTRQDSLTGLYNYEECHRRLQQLIHDKQSLMLILIDCHDLKSKNTTGGFHAGNLILKQISDLLKILFSDALLVSRYGGDEFAVVIPLINAQDSSAAYKQLLDSELPKLTGIQITYGIARYPIDVLTKDDLILQAEHHLFMQKREAWLKREEHLLRSEKLRVVGELASGMAHEIRNPLTTVRGFLQISKANGYNIENWYAMIMSEIDRMSELTAEFLQFSKPHLAKFHVHSLHVCVLKVVSLMESEATRLGHKIHYSETFQPAPVMMDPDKMVQLLLNLVKNACEAITENGAIQINLSCTKKYATLVIEDNGPGIPSDLLEKIFHPFFTTKESGTGLGLSICHKIVQDHEGTMEVESTLEQGTRFIITFPLATEKEQNMDEQKAAVI